MDFDSISIKVEASAGKWKREDQIGAVHDSRKKKWLIDAAGNNDVGKIPAVDGESAMQLAARILPKYAEVDLGTEEDSA